MIVYNNRDHGNAIAAKIGCVWNPEADPVVSSVASNGQLLGGVIYEKFAGASIFCHIAGFKPNWGTMDFLWVGFHYPFVQLGVNKLLALVRGTNAKALAIATRLGFKEAARIADAYPDGDLVIFEMHREDCRWLRIKPKGVRSNI